MKQSITTLQLLKATELLLEYVEKFHKTSVISFEDDDTEYIQVPHEYVYEALEGARNLGLGIINDDIERILKILKDRETLNKFDLIHLGAIFKQLGELLK